MLVEDNRFQFVKRYTDTVTSLLVPDANHFAPRYNPATPNV